MKCLKCNAERNLQDLQCPECGVFYAKYEAYLEKKAIEDKVVSEKELKQLKELERKEQEYANTEVNPTPKKKRISSLPLFGYVFWGFVILVLISAVTAEKQPEQKTSPQTSVENVATVIQKKREEEKKDYDAMTPEQRAQVDAVKAKIAANHRAYNALSPEQKREIMLQKEKSIALQKEAAAREIPLSVPSDSAQYFVLDKIINGNERIIVTKRVGSSGTSYSKRLYNCDYQTVKYLGDGDSMAEMESSAAIFANQDMASIVENSIAYYVGIEACK
jgi:hypothetical protein